ncbi:hypothetical protein [Streptomyces sp. NPDC053542]|uniref:hypothetical protein n=1 Tax=Streptomyces sp. NPDC053542 TaxID=3365710 RepID=UPI0037D6C504
MSSPMQQPSFDFADLVGTLPLPASGGCHSSDANRNNIFTYRRNVATQLKIKFHIYCSRTVDVAEKAEQSSYHSLSEDAESTPRGTLCRAPAYNNTDMVATFSSSTMAPTD